MSDTTKSSRWSLYFTFFVIGAIVLVFVVAFITATNATSNKNHSNLSDGPAENLTAETYLDAVAVLLADANAANGEVFITEKYECYVCHIEGGGQIAPHFDSLAEHAASEREPLPPAAYIYESIAYPSVHIVEGYRSAMPANYLNRFEEGEFGDILLYLLQTYVE